jgi:hypothetical protein
MKVDLTLRGLLRGVDIERRKHHEEQRGIYQQIIIAAQRVVRQDR